VDTTRELNNRSADQNSQLSSLLDHHLSLVSKFGPNWNTHTLLTMQRQSISRILYYNMLYSKIVGVPGIIMEFGVHWGATLAQLIALRGIYEPFNHSRHIYGFDTFSGFSNTCPSIDGGFSSDGDYSVFDGYEHTLEKILELHEANCPVSHIKKFHLVKGDASKTTKDWVKNNPHAIVAMAIFDMDIYHPTKNALEAILPLLTRGSLLVFDELNYNKFPGETIALREVLSTKNIKLHHYPHQPSCAWAVWGE
tara:strand:- start:2663 stop:3418 length:756 start_codon:yes stop_codon:yes gene_type:complete